MWANYASNSTASKFGNYSPSPPSHFLPSSHSSVPLLLSSYTASVEEINDVSQDGQKISNKENKTAIWWRCTILKNGENPDATKAKRPKGYFPSSALQFCSDDSFRISESFIGGLWCNRQRPLYSWTAVAKGSREQKLATMPTWWNPQCLSTTWKGIASYNVLVDFWIRRYRKRWWKEMNINC